MGNRDLKKEIRLLLTAEDFRLAMTAFDRMVERQAVNPLLSFFYDADETVRWHAISAFGRVLTNLAHRDMESARVIMRRLIWSLNDESGGIGWGSPEAMGETMACQAEIARQYAHILVSYINPDGNFLEHEVLQRGLLWGLGRLAHVRPHQVKAATPFLHPFLQSSDAIHRGLAAWGLGALMDTTSIPLLKSLTDDKTTLSLYTDLQFQHCAVGELARNALAVMDV